MRFFEKIHLENASLSTVTAGKSLCDDLNLYGYNSMLRTEDAEKHKHMASLREFLVPTTKSNTNASILSVIRYEHVFYIDGKQNFYDTLSFQLHQNTKKIP